jgi:hypothetical protein
MSQPPPIAPLPTLSYYEDQRSESLVAIVRLVLWAGVVTAIASSIGSAAMLWRSWPQIAFPSSIRGFTEIWALLAIMANTFAEIGCATGCALMLATSQGRVFTLWAEIVGIGTKAALSTAYVISYLNLNTKGFPPHFLGAEIAQLVMGLIAGCAVPLLVIVTLTRKDLRRGFAATT